LFSSQDYVQLIALELHDMDITVDPERIQQLEIEEFKRQANREFARRGM
jgi:hypothetical protein